MSQEQAFLIGGGQIHRMTGERGETPPCPEAKFKRGDVVKVRRNQAVGHFPPELIVLVAIPPGFSPDDAMAGTPTPKADALRAMREAKAERIEAAKAKAKPRENRGRKVGEPCGESGKPKAKMAKR